MYYVLHAEPFISDILKIQIPNVLGSKNCGNSVVPLLPTEVVISCLLNS